MSMIDRSLDGMAALSGQLGAMVQRRLREAGGIALISLAMLAALALATWSVQDPSLSHATDAPVHNLLGLPGAVAADLMMQLLGLGSLALLLPIAVWGYRLLGHRRLYREKFDLADQIIGDRYHYQRPAGGFFLWLDVSAQGGSEAVTQRLWREAGVRVVPGRYLAQEQADGSNPGADYIRVAMVQNNEITAEAMHRLVAVLG